MITREGPFLDLNGAARDGAVSSDPSRGPRSRASVQQTAALVTVFTKVRVSNVPLTCRTATADVWLISAASPRVIHDHHNDDTALSGCAIAMKPVSSRSPHRHAPRLTNRSPSSVVGHRLTSSTRERLPSAIGR
jgi:hypothetical protein